MNVCVCLCVCACMHTCMYNIYVGIHSCFTKLTKCTTLLRALKLMLQKIQLCPLLLIKKKDRKKAVWLQCSSHLLFIFWSIFFCNVWYHEGSLQRQIYHKGIAHPPLVISLLFSALLFSYMHETGACETCICYYHTTGLPCLLACCLVPVTWCQ